MSSPMLFSDLDFSRVTFSEPIHQKGRASKVYVNYDGKKLPPIQTALCKVAFNGISVFSADGARDQYSLEQSFGGADVNEQIAMMQRKVGDFDDFLVSAGVKHSKEWFKQPGMTEQVCRAFLTPGLRVPKDKDTGEPTDKWPRTFKLKLTPNEDASDFNFPIYPISDAKCPDRVSPPTNIQDYVPKGSRVRAILKCGGLWIAAGRFGCTWYVEQLQVEPSERFTGCAFIPTGEERAIEGDAALSASDGKSGAGSDDGDIIDSDGE